MKKINALIAAALFISVYASAQQYSNNNSLNYKSYSNNMLTSSYVKSRFDVIANPVKGAVTIQISHPDAVKYELSLYSTSGQKLTSILYEHPGGESTKTMYVNSGTQPGMYYLVAVSKQEKRLLKVFVQ